MTETRNNQNQFSCSDAMMLWDNELADSISPDSRSAAVRHMDSCKECSDFVKVAANLSKLSLVPSEDQVDAAIRSITRRAREQRMEIHTAAPRWRMFAFAAAFAAFVAIGVLVMSIFTSGRNEAPFTPECTPSSPRELVPGVFMTLCNEKMAPTYTQKNGDVLVQLDQGTIGMRVDPNRRDKHMVRVSTPQGDVQVKGTVFTVRTSDQNTWVEVFRGVVQVIPVSNAAKSFHISAGSGGELSTRNQYALSTPGTDILRHTLMADEERAAMLIQSQPNDSNAAMLSAADSEDGTAEVPSTDPDETAQLDTDTVPDEQNAENADEGAQQHEGGTVARYTIEGMHTLIQNAQTALINQDWQNAARQYREVLIRYPRRPESLPVLISLAKIELRYLNAPNDALRHYQTYQRRAPNGPLGEEALFGIAETYRRLGRVQEEEQALRRFVQLYPDSSHTQKNLARLQQLRN